MSNARTLGRRTEPLHRPVTGLMVVKSIVFYENPQNFQPGRIKHEHHIPKYFFMTAVCGKYISNDYFMT